MNQTIYDLRFAIYALLGRNRRLIGLRNHQPSNL